MFLYNAVLERADANNPVLVCLIGAGKFGSMFLSQVPTTPGLEVIAIIDLNPEQAKRTCLQVGWPTNLIARTTFSDDINEISSKQEIDVMVEATGNPIAGISHALFSIKNGWHTVMVNVEADVLAGAYLSKLAQADGLVYSMAYGDQPALTCELVEWARSIGFGIVAAGKGTKYLPSYHSSTPDTVWDYYGLSSAEAANAGMNSQMFNSFIDGTKSGLEMAAIANATNLQAPEDGLLFPPAGVEELANVLRPKSMGGFLERKGQVEVVSSLKRNGCKVFGDLRWGVYVVIEATNDYTARCFKEYGMNTDDSGRFSAMYKPFHLIGLELNVSIFSAALLNKPTGSTQNFQADVIATAKRELAAGEILDGEGGYMVWGKLVSAKKSVAIGGLPIGLTSGLKLKRRISSGSPVLWNDIEFDNSLEVFKIRKNMENEFKSG